MRQRKWNLRQWIKHMLAELGRMRGGSHLQASGIIRVVSPDATATTAAAITPGIRALGNLSTSPV